MGSVKACWGVGAGEAETWGLWGLLNSQSSQLVSSKFKGTEIDFDL